MNTTIRRGLAAASIALVAALGVTACSSSDAKDPTPTASSTTKAAQTTYNECIDGAVQLWDDDEDSDKTITTEDCAAANLISSDRTYDLGTIDTITVEASNATISVSSTKKVYFSGSNNTLTYKGEAPKVDDQGKGNTIAAAG
jgi:peptidylprolyl isomerase